MFKTAIAALAMSVACATTAIAHPTTYDITVSGVSREEGHSFVWFWSANTLVDFYLVPSGVLEHCPIRAGQRLSVSTLRDETHVELSRSQLEALGGPIGSSLFGGGVIAYIGGCGHTYRTIGGGYLEHLAQ